jgi:hypothetical protein
MNLDTTHDTLKEKVLERIRSGQVKMHGHAYFAAKTILLVVGVVLALLFGIFAVSFLLFLLQANGLLLLPAFGMTGLVKLLTLFPWLIVVLALVFMILLELFVQRFAFAYHQPIMYTVLGIFLLVIIAGTALAQTPLHQALADFTKNSPLFSQLYHSYVPGHDRGLYVGRVLRVEGDRIELIAPGVSGMPIWLTSNTILPAGRYFHPADRVMVMCQDECSEGMEAVGVKKLKEQDFEMYRRAHE